MEVNESDDSKNDRKHASIAQMRDGARAATEALKMSRVLMAAVFTTFIFATNTISDALQKAAWPLHRLRNLKATACPSHALT